MKFAAFFLSTAALAQAPLRPPAVPLIVHDPYFSVWSMGDLLTSETKHWSGVAQPLAGVIRVDGKAFRFLGGQWRWADPIPPLKQTKRDVTPTRTLYSFEGGGISLDVTFTTPALVTDLDTLSRPGDLPRLPRPVARWPPTQHANLL